MRIYASDQPLPDMARGASLALGSFDGVHLGHQAVLASAVTAARARGLAVAASVFEPHPRRYFQPDAPPFRLQSAAQMAHAMADLGVDCVIEIRFDEALARLSADAFIDDVLKRRLDVAHVSVGFNFHFGSGRGGNAETLIAAGARLGFGVSVAERVEFADSPTPISSTSIRQAVAAGDMATAARLLGRPWAIEGAVAQGFQRGRTIGFPTANVALGDYLRPRLGIYAVNVHVGAGDWRPGVASVGVNPTVGALPEPVLEAHLFDFDADLYGRVIEVELVAFLREEQKFPDMETMTRQIEQDAAQARALLS